MHNYHKKSYRPTSALSAYYYLQKRDVWSAVSSAIAPQCRLTFLCRQTGICGEDLKSNSGFFCPATFTYNCHNILSSQCNLPFEMKEELRTANASSSHRVVIDDDCNKLSPMPVVSRSVWSNSPHSRGRTEICNEEYLHHEDIRAQYSKKPLHSWARRFSQSKARW